MDATYMALVMTGRFRRADGLTPEDLAKFLSKLSSRAEFDAIVTAMPDEYRGPLRTWAGPAVERKFP
jgi:hypothetical protein